MYELHGKVCLIAQLALCSVENLEQFDCKPIRLIWHWFKIPGA